MKTSILLICSLLLLGGCAKKCEPTIKTEYVKVEVPVVYKLTRPERPQYTNKDTLPSYLAKLKAYTKQLENIIDNCK